MILAGDIGGTKTRLAYVTDTFHLAVEQTFASRDFATFAEILQTFIQQHDVIPTAACFGIAGPIKKGRCEATNLPWIVDTKDLEEQLNLSSVGLINDLLAHASGLAVLPKTSFVALKTGEPEPEGNQAMLAAGTGLGEAGLYWDGKAHHPFSSEGGHADFAPVNELQIDLLRYLQQKFKRVSWERVLSGPGIYNLYTFLRDRKHGQESPDITEKMQHHDPSAVITEAALKDTDGLCVATLDFFVSLYGAQAGNIALNFLATGGVFIGGGIAPKILPKLCTPTFTDAFTAKGRLSSLLEAIPVWVVTDDRAALYGAAHVAQKSG
jgi:glucokinase